MKHLVRIAAFLAGALLLVACQGAEVPESPLPSTREQRSFGLYHNGSLDQALRVQIRAGSTYKRTFSLTDMSVERDYVLIVLDNLKQREFLVEGTMHKHFTFHAIPGQPVSIPMEMSLEPGWHEVVILAFKQPGESSIEPEIRRTLTGVAASIRQVVIVGDGEAPLISPLVPDQLDTNEVLDGITLSRTPKDIKAWPWTRVAPGGTLTVYPRVGNTSDRDQDYAIVAFLDWEQVQIRENLDALTMRVPSQQIATVEHQIAIPTAGEFHEYQVVLIPSPYQLTKTTPLAEGAYRLALIKK